MTVIGLLIAMRGQPRCAVLRVRDLADALTGEADRADDVDLAHALVAGFPDGGEKVGVGGILSRFVALVALRQLTQSLTVHRTRIGYANLLDKRTPGMPRWLA